MKKIVTGLMIAALAVVNVFAGGTTGKTAVVKGTKSIGDLKIVLILPGPVSDQSWNATNYAGLTACNDQLGTKMEYIENVQASDYESTMRNYAERGYNLIMAAGTQFDDAAENVASDYPAVTFCVVNGLKATKPNLSPIYPKEYEASYVAGLIAGQVSASGNFATIGGFPNLSMKHLLDTYEVTAVKTAKERGLNDSKATRAYANSFDNIALGKQMAETMIDKGADTLFVYANQVGLGSIQAAREKGVKFIGFSSNQNDIAPGTVVASVIFDFRIFYTWAVKQYYEGTLTGGTVHEAGIKEGIFVPVYTNAVSAAAQSKVQTGIAAFKAGSVDLKTLFKD